VTRTAAVSFPHESSPKALAAASRLAVDSVSASVFSALARANVPAILLKGPSITPHLYEERNARLYADTDVLVSPREVDQAAKVLGDLDFESSVSAPSLMLAGERGSYVSLWTRASDGAVVELHRRVIGIEADAQTAWDILSSETEPMGLLGSSVTVFNERALALHIALHAIQDGGRMPQPMEDLRRAIDALPESTWHDAARLAKRLHATAAMSSGLRLLPAGRLLAEELQLPTTTSVEVQLHAGRAPRGAIALEWMWQRHPTARAGAVLRKLFPPSDFVRAWSSLARRGPWGLGLAYIWRPLWIVARLPAALLSWMRTRRRVRGSHGP
jgi:hypothetical protein